jgi:outer membrane protein OmpA-like peptidoglycan-associated protein
MKTRCSLVLSLLSTLAGGRPLWAAPVGVSRADEVTTPLPPEPGSEVLQSSAGPIGLPGMSTAEAGAPGQLRLALTGQYMRTSNFILQGDRDLRLMGALAVGFTPRRFFEIYASASSSANRNRRSSETGRSDPEVIKSYGDLALGGKVAVPVKGGLSVGGEVGLRLLSSVSALAFNPAATSPWLTGLCSWDLRGSGAPIQLHLGWGFLWDNSPALADYRGVSRTSRAVSQFAYGIAHDRMRASLGAEWLIEQIAAVGVRPFVEYHLELIAGAADAAFADYRPPLCTAAGLPCRDNRDQHWLSGGLRARTRAGLAVGAGVDLAIKSAGFPYGPPLAPYDVMLTVGHALDLAAPRVVTRTVTVERLVPVEKTPREGFVAGKVVDAVRGTPVEGAIVAVAGRPQSRVATDPDGTFKTAALPPGPAQLEVTAASFVPASIPAAVVAGQEAPVAVTLTPRVEKGKVTGRITDDHGQGVEATVRFSGPQSAEVKADPSGAFSTALPGGAYLVRVDRDGILAKETRLSLADGQQQDLSVSVRSRPAVPRVVVREGKLLVRQPVAFKGAGPAAEEIAPAAAAVLDELADALLTHPEVKRLRIEAHWDSSLPRDRAQELTDHQAKAICAYLAKQGVSEDRLEAAGLGIERPLVPNIGTAKQRNRRVEFHVPQ